MQGLWVLNGCKCILVLELRQHILQGLIMIPFQIILSLRTQFHQVQQRDFGFLALMRLPECEQLLHLLAVQFHPLPPKLDQRRFSIHKLLPLIFSDYLTSHR